MFDGKTVHTLHFTTIGSTNTWAKNHAETLDHKALTCITSEQQTSGRGQQGKTWYSPLGNLYATFFFVLPKNFAWVANLGQILGFSIAQVLQELGFNPSLKWPNDILLDEKKTGGILSEVCPLADGLGIVLGLGMNVGVAEETLAHLDQPATSLSAYSKNLPPLSLLLQTILQKFLLGLAKLRQSGFSGFAHEYNQLLAFQGEEVTFTTAENTFLAICDKIDEEGRLVLLCPNGEKRHLTSGILRKNREGFNP